MAFNCTGLKNTTMTFSEHEFPILRFLREGSLEKMKYLSYDTDMCDREDIANMEENFVKNQHFFKSDIKYITKPFVKAMCKAAETLMKNEDTKISEVTHGVLLNFEIPIPGLSVAYSFRTTGDAAYFLFLKDTFVGYGYSMPAGDGKNNKEYSVFSKLLYDFFEQSDRYATLFESMDEQTKANNIHHLFLVCIEIYLMFITYARVETKELTKGKVFRDINCKYTNLSNNRINILDSKWFTNLVKSDAFNVRGHFRLQPYGAGWSEKKLIWISEFQKTGYTATAGKIKSGFTEEIGN